jgi:hypothetical protein
MAAGHWSLASLPVAAAIVGLSVLLAACGGTASPTVANISTTTAPTAGSANSPSGNTGAQLDLDRFVFCMRHHGVPNFPDLVTTPNGGSVPVGSTSGIDKNSQKVQAALAMCQKILPPDQRASGTAASLPPTITPQDEVDYLKVTGCMRAHGFPDFPDPGFFGNNVRFALPPGMNATIGNSPQFLRAREICEKLVPDGLPYSKQAEGGR